MGLIWPERIKWQTEGPNASPIIFIPSFQNFILHKQCLNADRSRFAINDVINVKKINKMKFKTVIECEFC